jgi:hypothetical protein
VIRTSKLCHEGLTKVLAKVLSQSKYQIWTEPRLNSPAEIVAHPDDIDALFKLLEDLGLEPVVHIENVEM